MTCSAAATWLAGEPELTLEHAEPAVESIARGYFDPIASLAAACAISAGRALHDEAATDRWIELSLARPQERMTPAVQARDAFARAERAVEQGSLDFAIEAFDKSARRFAENPPHPLCRILGPAAPCRNLLGA